MHHPSIARCYYSKGTGVILLGVMFKLLETIYLLVIPSIAVRAFPEETPLASGGFASVHGARFVIPLSFQDIAPFLPV